MPARRIEGRSEPPSTALATLQPSEVALYNPQEVPAPPSSTALATLNPSEVALYNSEKVPASPSSSTKVSKSQEPVLNLDIDPPTQPVQNSTAIDANPNRTNVLEEPIEPSQPVPNSIVEAVKLNVLGGDGVASKKKCIEVTPNPEMKKAHYDAVTSSIELFPFQEFESDIDAILGSGAMGAIYVAVLRSTGQTVVGTSQELLEYVKNPIGKSNQDIFAFTTQSGPYNLASLGGKSWDSYHNSDSVLSLKMYLETSSDEVYQMAIRETSFRGSGYFADLSIASSLQEYFNSERAKALDVYSRDYKERYKTTTQNAAVLHYINTGQKENEGWSLSISFNLFDSIGSMLVAGITRFVFQNTLNQFMPPIQNSQRTQRTFTLPYSPHNDGAD